MRVDVHTHFFHPSYFDLLEAAGAADQLESYAVFGPMLRPSSERLFSAGTPAVFEDWIGQMDRSSVDLAVLSMGAFQPYFREERTAADVARRCNVLLRDTVADNGRGRFRAFGSLPLPHTEAALRELRFCLDECDFTGISLGTSAGDLPFDAPQFDQVWAALDERRATVFIHPGTSPRMGVGSTEFHLAPDFCSPTETALALCRLVVGGVTTRYPNMRIVAAAFGGALPFFAHRFDSGMQRSHPELYAELGGVIPQLQRFWYDTSMVDEPFVFDSIRRSVGVDRLVFGSDLPRAPLADVVDFVAESPLLSDTEKVNILDVQGSSLLGLDDDRAAAIGFQP